MEEVFLMAGQSNQSTENTNRRIILSNKLPTSQFVRDSLEENRFWLRIMMEHAFFLEQGFAKTDSKLIKEAQRFQGIFRRQLNRALTTGNDPQAVRRLNNDSILLTRQIRNFKKRVFNDIITCRIRGFNFPLLVDHVKREANYFLRTLQDLNMGKMEPLKDEIVSENVFFLRIMAEHSKFISHLLDPTEKQLINKANQFDRQFTTLFFQARNIQLPTKQSEIRFLDKVEGATTELRNFKRQATRLLENCQIRSIIDPRLAAHVTREANKFLKIIERLEERV